MACFFSGSGVAVLLGTDLARAFGAALVAAFFGSATVFAFFDLGSWTSSSEAFRFVPVDFAALAAGAGLGVADLALGADLGAASFFATAVLEVLVATVAFLAAAGFLVVEATDFGVADRLDLVAAGFAALFAAAVFAFLGGILKDDELR